MVGTTTNGMLLNTETIRQVVECGVDVLAFSLAGVDERNDAVRQGTSFDRILEAIWSLHKRKEKVGKELPVIHIAYMLLRSGLGDVEQLPLVLKGLGVSQVVISTLDFVPCKELADETIMPSTLDEYEGLRAQLEAVKVKGEQFGLRVHYELYNPGGRRPTCTENVQGALFVSADGMVSPCVFTNLPISQETQVFSDGERTYRRLIFGNVSDTSVGAIWWGKAYRGFRKAFKGDRLPNICEDCPKLFIG